MARIRTIKPDFFKNEQLADLPVIIRLLFIGLWTQADRDGKLEDRPKRLKAEIFPYDNIDIDKALDQLQAAGLIFRYKVNVNASGRVLAPEQPDNQVGFIKILTFKKHQQPNVKEAKSVIPEPDFLDHCESTVLVQCSHGESITGREGKGKEGNRKGREGEYAQARPLSHSEDNPLNDSDFSKKEKKESGPPPYQGNRLNEFEKNCLEESPTWLANIGKAIGIIDLEEVSHWVRMYFDEMRARDEIKINLADTRKHCFSWIKIEISKQNEKKQKQAQAQPRRGVEAAMEWSDVKRWKQV